MTLIRIETQNWLEICLKRFSIKRFTMSERKEVDKETWNGIFQTENTWIYSEVKWEKDAI